MPLKKGKTEPRSPEVISYTMSKVRGKNTSIEVALRKALWRAGLRYRVNYRLAAGTPDIVFPKAKVAIFCDGSFWHGKDWGKKKNRLRSNKKYWINKIETNMRRDTLVNQKLEGTGWTVLRFWDVDILKSPQNIVDKIKSAITGLR